ncbi:MAG TPA: lactate utilization protein B/C [Bacteroidales bacterium]|nr:lactate utilization protein B/C [Bacteroidales bacterium]
MKESTSKEKVLKKVRSALIEKVPALYDYIEADKQLFVESEHKYPDVEFAEAFTKLGGNFLYSQDEEELRLQLATILEENGIKKLFCSDDFLRNLIEFRQIEIFNLPEQLSQCDASLTFCENLVSRLGAVVMSSKVSGGRGVFAIPPIHIVVAYPSQIVYDIKDAFASIHTRNDGNYPSMITFVAGPSRTADIEKTLVMGAHGPKVLYLFLTESNK